MYGIMLILSNKAGLCLLNEVESLFLRFILRAAIFYIRYYGSKFGAFCDSHLYSIMSFIVFRSLATLKKQKYEKLECIFNH